MKNKNQFKRVLSVLIAISLLMLSFTSCSFLKKATDTDAGSSTTDTSSQTEKTTPTSEETSTTAEESTTTLPTTEEPTAAQPVITTTQASEQYQEPEQKKSTRDLSAFKGKKLIAITFDDGPAGAASTGKLLDNLDKYNARVTFFVVGNRVANYASMLKREYEMGNQIASHSYTHANLAKLSEQKIKEEISKTDSAIKKVIGAAPDCLRPPYGSLNDTVKKAAGKHIITWSIDTLDWKNKNAETVCNNIVNKAFDGAIVLLHDLYPTSVDGALKAMKILQEKGYAFVTVDEMAELRGVKMTNTKVYNNFKPAS